MKNTVEFEIVKMTEELKRQLQVFHPDTYYDVEVGKWEVKVVVTDHLDKVTIEYVGPFRTKKEAQESKVGLKRGKTYK
ncbi:MAG TPA: hypothetical protein DCS66_14745 [Flavobacteriaceae bacterium]|nr:hypothetical protein [Flavobacteriaceae bacterium]